MVLKKLITTISVVLLISVLMAGCSKSKNPIVTTEEKHTGIDGYYVYPEKPIGGGKYYAIPKQTLTAMTDEQLAQAIIDFPRYDLAGVLFLGPTLPKEGEIADRFREECDAYAELIQRGEFGVDALCKKIEETIDKASGEIVYPIIQLSTIILDDMLLRPFLTMEQIEMLEKYDDNPSH